MRARRTKSLTERGTIFSTRLEEVIATFQDQCKCVFVPPTQPVIVPAAMLAAQEAPCIIVSQYPPNPQMDRVGVIDVGVLVEKLTEHNDVWRHLMRLTTEEVARTVPIMEKDDSLEDLFKQMTLAGIDVAVVRAERGGRAGVIDLLTVLRFFAIKSLARQYLRNFKVAQVCSGPPLISIDTEYSIRDSIRLALNKGIKRLVVKPTDVILSLRSIVRFFFGSIQNLELLRDDPDRILNLPVGELGDFLQHPAFVESGDIVVTALDRLISSEAKCCLLRDGVGIITPSDLTLKLYHRFRS